MGQVLPPPHTHRVTLAGAWVEKTLKGLVCEEGGRF